MIKPVGNFAVFLKSGASCRYNIKFPQEAGDYDQIALKVNKGTRVKIWTVDTKLYTDPDFKEAELITGQLLMIENPHMIFLTIVSQEETAGNFELSYKYIDRDPDEVRAGQICQGVPHHHVPC